jgi:hypothetical protein
MTASIIHGAKKEAKLDTEMTATETPPPLAQNGAKGRGRPFEPGTSGNPNGRPKGHRNKATLAMEELLDGDAPALTRKVIERALEGDMVAMRLCLDRVLPPRRDRPVAFALPRIESVKDVPAAAAAILEACADGMLSPGEADEIMNLLSTYGRTLADTEIEARLAALEKERPSP